MNQNNGVETEEDALRAANAFIQDSINIKEVSSWKLENELWKRKLKENIERTLTEVRSAAWFAGGDMSLERLADMKFGKLLDILYRNHIRLEVKLTKQSHAVCDEI